MILDRKDIRSVHQQKGPAHVIDTLPVALPVGRLPVHIRGRDPVLAALRSSIFGRPRKAGMTWVLTGMGGVGKSTVALAVAESMRTKGWRVWWVTATDTASLVGGILEVLRDIGAPESIIAPVREGAPTGAQRAWEYLNGKNPAGRRWLLVFDNADDPALLAGPGSSNPADYSGWVRPDPAGTVILTSRVVDESTWGSRIAFRELQPLDETAASQVLADLAPGIADPGHQQAKELGSRLGGLPLALHLAGNYLAAPFARWSTFEDYRRALDSADGSEALADLDQRPRDSRAMIGTTWDLSLDALTASGLPQARSLLILLSCFAPATEIPPALLRSGPVHDLIKTDANTQESFPPESAAQQERLFWAGLRGLATVGLLNVAAQVDGSHVAQGANVHPVVADVNRNRLLSMLPTDRSRIANAVVGLLGEGIKELSSQNPADWPAWHQVIPHINSALVLLAAHLETEQLAKLLSISNSAGEALLESGNLSAAEDMARLSADAANGLNKDHPASLTARCTLGLVLEKGGKFKEAEELYRQVLTRRCLLLGKDNPETFIARYRLAEALMWQGQYDEAERQHRELLADQVRVLGDGHIDILVTKQALAWIVAGPDRYAEAEQLYCEVLDGRLRLLGADHPDTLRARSTLAWVLGMQGLHAESEQLYRTLLPDRRRILGDDHPDTLMNNHTLAWLAALQGRLQEAEERYRQVLSDRQRVLGDEHHHFLITLQDLAWVLGLQGRYGEAEQYYREVLSSRESVLGKDHPHTEQTRQKLADIMQARNQSTTTARK